MEDIPWTYCCNLRRGLFVRHWTSTSTRAGKPRHIPLPCVKSSRGKVRAKICQKTSRWTFAMSELSPKMVWNSFSHKKKVFLVLSQKVWDQFGPQFEAGLIHPSKIFLFFWEKLFLSDFKSGVVVFVSPNFHLSFMTTTRPIRSSTKTKLKQDISNIWTTKLFALSFFPALSISLLVSFTQFLALPFKLFWFRNCSLLP